MGPAIITRYSSRSHIMRGKNSSISISVVYFFRIRLRYSKDIIGEQKLSSGHLVHHGLTRYQMHVCDFIRAVLGILKLHVYLGIACRQAPETGVELHSETERLRLNCTNELIGTHIATFSNIHILPRV